MLRHLRIFLSLSVLLTGCATLPAAIDRTASVPELRGAIWGIDVEDDSGRTLYQRNAHTLLMPASNRKLFAASTAIDCFGIDHQFPTELWLDGSDVVLRGGADPSLGGRWAFNRDAIFTTFVDALRARGITAVEDVIADPSMFDRETIPGSWKFGNLGSDYAAPVDALAFNENVSGDSAVADPALYAAQALRDALRNGGIEVRGEPRVNFSPREWQERVAVIGSPFLSQLTATMLKVSQNLYAEMLFKATAGTYSGAEEIERSFLTNEVHITGSEFRFVDGCGLAPDDLVTPAAIVTLLRWMNAPQRRGVFWDLLATPAEEGTLHRRLLPLASRLRGKTGTIAGVNALSGIIAGTHGGYRYFSILVNHHTAQSSAVTHAIDAIVNEIANF
jgi:D-alanyl-D-alanine carboxypeptidase/D-alanyl-D-alanine-endopeptidase (penicillin-binding protein 4)